MSLLNKKLKTILSVGGVIAAGVGIFTTTQKKFDKNINLSNKYLEDAKNYVLQNLDGEITSSYIYRDEEDNLHGCVNLTKEDHKFSYKFDVCDEQIIFVK